MNPDDITVKLYSKNIISVTEMEEIQTQLLSMSKRTELLLSALKRAISIDYEHFLTFLDCLDELSNYHALVVGIKNELYK